ncbi:Prefoldin, subunit 4 [Linderina pennispora]|uniref:Prefoldin subunit 4 n=1 Tax=Linderina pennispora TaxID=61395 RepID=A0A1Y1WAK7_9FUNG|nr:Prefoldin, subunit 4 [Linderina pennispora]ORX70577.1 Prefoldin, subunit 4 [Linderina pennispora]
MSGKFPLDERDVEVNWEDQQRINQIHTRVQKTEKEYLDDLAMEIELLDEEEPVPYRVGDTFVMLPLEEAQERVEKNKDAIDARVEDLDKQISDISEEMEVLKKELYGKFGRAINLEKD